MKTINMEPTDKFILENSEENFEKLIYLCNFYNKKLTEYSTVLKNMPVIQNEKGYVVTQETLSEIQTYIRSCEGTLEYAKKLMYATPPTIH